VKATTNSHGPAVGQKMPLGGENFSRSSGLKKLLKIVNAKMNKEIDEND